ncbi:glycosyltransferase [Plantibacter sp. YIM 135249]|uniref:glycosyltransferase n=1 Tax=Plantibacter sp. YIM 135249 TaxID=3423918 RepID=UPI003D34E9E0
MPHESTPLRIAMVSLHTSPGDEPGSGDAGGMNVVVRHQADAMAAAGHTVDLITRRSSAEQPARVELAERVTLWFVDAGPAHPVPKGDHEGFIADFESGLDVVLATIRAEAGSAGGVEGGSAVGTDLIHSHHWFSGMAGLPVARRLVIPHVQSFHSIAADESTPLSAGERPESPGRLAGEAWLAQQSDSVVAISEAEAETVITRLGGSPDHVAVVPPGVDGVLFHPRDADAPSAAPSDRGYAIVAGRLQPLKGFDLAIEAIAHVPASIRPELVVAGDVSADYDEYIAELSRLAAADGIEREVRFVGPQSRSGLAALLRDARLVLVPSHSETYGLVALEAAASGVPVVAAASGGLREAVVDGVTGVVLDTRDPEIWAETITRILDDATLARQLSAAARQRAELLDWERSADGLVSVYRQLLETPVLRS